MSRSELKDLFRRNLKQVAGGPPVGTPGSNRTAGVLISLDALADAIAASAPSAVFTGADADTGTINFQLPAGASTNLADYQLVIYRK